MRNLNKILLMVFFGIALLCFGSASRVDATAILVLDDGTGLLGGRVEIVDNGVLDASSGDGIITYAGNVGTIWDINFTFGATKPFSGGSIIAPDMDLLSSQVSSSTGGTLTLTFSDDGYLATPLVGGVYGISTVLAGTTDGVADFEFILEENDGTLTTMATLGTNSPTNNGPNLDDAFVYDFIGVPATPYSLSIVASISHTGEGITLFDAFLEPSYTPAENGTAPVPEPATILLIGIGLAGLAGGRFLRKKNRILDVNRTEG